MSSYLDKTGLTYFWNKIKTIFAKRADLADTAFNGVATHSKALLAQHGNEVNFAKPGTYTTVWIGYRFTETDGTESRSDTITRYRFGNGNAKAIAELECGDVYLNDGTYATSLLSVLATKQATLTAAQLAAVDSGVTSEVLSVDRAALVELVDSGAKNKLSWSTSNKTHNGVTFVVNSDGTVTANGTNNGSSNSFISLKNMTADEIGAFEGYVLSGTETNSANAYISLEERGGSYRTYCRDRGSGVEIPAISTGVNVYIVVPKNATVTNLTFKPMICTATAYAISTVFQPFRPSYQELYERVIALESATGVSPVQSTAQLTALDKTEELTTIDDSGYTTENS